MSEWENNRNDCLSASRSLGRISTATRVIGILAIVGGVFLLFAAMDMRSSSDKMGFSIMSIAVVLFGILVWSVGSFHGATARTIPALIERLDYLCMRAAPAPAAAPSPPVVAPEMAPAPAVDQPPAQAVPEPEVEPGATPLDQQPQAGEPEPEPEAQAAPEPEEEIERTPCPHCGGLTHPAATRCVHCMKKIERLSA